MRGTFFSSTDSTMRGYFFPYVPTILLLPPFHNIRLYIITHIYIDANESRYICV